MDAGQATVRELVWQAYPRMMAPMPEGGISREATRRWPLYSGIAAVVVAVALGMLILVGGNGPTPVDAAWMQVVLEHREPWLEAPSRVLDYIGGGWVAQLLVPVVTILALLLARRRWGTLYYAGAIAVSMLSVQLLKALLERTRPEEMLVASDVGSFPSGHVANAATLVVVLSIVAARAWPWCVGAAYVVLMALSRTHLGAHWLTDTVGGALLGGGVAVILWFPLAACLASERDRRPIVRRGADS